MGLLGTVGSVGLGLALEGHNDRRQLEQNEALLNQQIRAQQKMGKYNQQLALEMWDKTNYEAQRKHMEKAGLNVGLMYGMSGGGGTTANTPGGNVGATGAEGQKGEVGMALQLGLQAELQKAQIEATRAQANKTNVEAQKLAGADTEKTGQETRNLQVQNLILQHEEKIKGVESRVQQDTEADQLEAIRNANDVSEGQAKSALAKGEIDQATFEDVIKQIQTTTIEQQIRIAAMKTGISKTIVDTEETKKAIQKISADIQNMTFEQRMKWENWTQSEKERWIKEQQLELNRQGINFQTGGGAETKRWAEIIGEIMKAVPKR